jgi:hypothetical protein
MSCPTSGNVVRETLVPVRSEVFTAMKLMILVIWDMTPCCVFGWVVFSVLKERDSYIFKGQTVQEELFFGLLDP